MTGINMHEIYAEEEKIAKLKKQIDSFSHHSDVKSTEHVMNVEQPALENFLSHQEEIQKPLLPKEDKLDERSINSADLLENIKDAR